MHRLPDKEKWQSGVTLLWGDTAAGQQSQSRCGAGRRIPGTSGTGRDGLSTDTQSSSPMSKSPRPGPGSTPEYHYEWQMTVTGCSNVLGICRSISHMLSNLQSNSQRYKRHSSYFAEETSKAKGGKVACPSFHGSRNNKASIQIQVSWPPKQGLRKTGT